MSTEQASAHRILITGGRSITIAQRGYVVRTVRALVRGALLASYGPIIVVHGAAPGVDTAVAETLTENPPHERVSVEAHPADWRRLGRSAGPRRNQQMIDLGAALCLAFPTIESVGTWGCVRMAAAAGIKIHIHPLMRDTTTLGEHP